MTRNENLVSLKRKLNYTRYVHLLPVSYILIFAFIQSACTTAAPSHEGSSTESSKQQVDPDLKVLKTLTADQEALAKSSFVTLTHHPKPLEEWEKSDGWVMFYQGKLSQALDAFKQESNQTQSTQIGVLRVNLELATTYQHLSEIGSYLINDWLSFERDRPNSKLHSQWYNLIEYLALTQDHTHTNRKSKLATLEQSLKQDEQMSAWLQVLTYQKDDFPNEPRLNPKYRKLYRFSQAVEMKAFDKAKKLSKKLKLDGKITISKGKDTIPDLSIYDPRLPRVLMTYYAYQVLESCSDVEFGSYYCGRAYEILDQPDKALSAYNNSISNLKTLLNQTKADSSKLETANELAHVLITSHTSMSSFNEEITARIKRLSSKVSAKDHDLLPKKRGQQDISTTSALLWQSISLNKEAAMPNIFPERRRALGMIYSQALEQAKGKYLDYVASLGLGDRWLDELHYLYAVELVKRDQRVRALKVLNAAEEAKAGSRLQGRNRLPRLLLSAFNQLKMGRHRVSSKYFQRLKPELPALSFALMMTSDILSGKSFEQNGSKANAGQ